MKKKKSLIVEQFQGNYLKQTPSGQSLARCDENDLHFGYI